MFKKIARLLDWEIDRVSAICLLLSGVVIVLMAFVTTYGVILRYIFDAPSPYPFEISRIFMLACVVLALAHAQRLGRNIRVDFMGRYFSEKMQAFLLNIIGPAMGLVFIIVVIWKSWEDALYALEINHVTVGLVKMPTYPVRFLVPVCVALLCLVLIAQMVRYVTSLRGKEKR